METTSNANQNQNQTKFPKSKRHLASVFGPLKLSDNLEPLLEKYNDWLPKFKGDATKSAHDHIEDFYWMASPRFIDDEDKIMMLFALSFEGQVREWYLSLSLGSIGDSDEFEDVFTKRWSFDAQGNFNIEKFYHISRGREGIKEFIQKFDKVVRDILDNLKPLYANILDKFIKVVGGHLTYELKDKKPNTLVEAKEIVMEVEKNLRISRMDVD